jgi:hypothetical protein
MSNQVSYCVTEVRSTEEGGASLFEVSGRNHQTGYQWLVAECNTREEARAVVIRKRQEDDEQHDRMAKEGK